MAIGQRLEIKQGQALVMTPQLQQAIKLLQMNNLELSAFIAEELERNPLLEIGSPTESFEPEPTRDIDVTPPPAGLDRDLAREDHSRAVETFDTGIENVYADMSRAERQAEGWDDGPAHKLHDGAHQGGIGAGDPGWSAVGSGGSSSFDVNDESFEARITRDQTLREHLLAQLVLVPCDTALRAIITHLIENVDEAGYCRVDVLEVAQMLGTDPARVEAGLRILQGFDPSGVGARDLAECLTIQLRERNRFDPAMAMLIAHLELLAKRDIQKLCKLCGVDLDDMQEMIAELRSLDPRPGTAFDHEPAQTLVPDVFVRPNAFGSWTVELNSDNLPRVLINQRYMAEVSRSLGEGQAAAAAREYLSEQHQNASWLIRSIDQRARTILKVSTEIVRQQDGFFAYGVQALRPLNLKTVADAIDMHESTVSRVTANKYMATPRGVFEMKFFFTSAIAASDGGEAHSAEAIRYRIKALIDGEKEEVLSDDRIVAILKNDGVDIARRTVAKYREAMSIPSSMERRRMRTADMTF